MRKWEEFEFGSGKAEGEIASHRAESIAQSVIENQKMQLEYLEQENYFCMWERFLAAKNVAKQATLFAAKSCSHNHETIVSGAQEKTGGIKPVLYFKSREFRQI